ncbi:MAG TPA: rhomboid family intramembrane serine protease [Fimbriimonadaceae bacterium]|nr:rhomboid family intramembrane serine protease [Fimbriimonadaceae bacterium]
MLLPIRSKNPPDSLPIATCILIVFNCVFFFLNTENGLIAREAVVDRWGLKSSNFDALHVLTSMFLHGDIFHLLGNMWFLYLFGFAVEGRIRTLKFTILYFAAGLCGDLLHHFLFGLAHPDRPMIGASGAIMGVMGAALYMFPFGKVDVFYWFGLVFHGVFTVPMWGIALWYLGTDFLLAVLLGAYSGVGHLAHLGGAAGGFVIAAVFRPTRDSAEASEAKSTFSETKDLTLLSANELAAMHKANPHDPLVVAHWMHRSMRDPQGPKAECREAYFRLLPRIIAELPPQSTGAMLAAMSTTPGAVPARYLLDVAGRLERERDLLTALRLYDAVVRDSASRPEDVEAALFRTALLCEMGLGQRDRAVHTYQEVIRRYPMSPFADQARVRLNGMVK